jgi:hypothetical protein
VAWGGPGQTPQHGTRHAIPAPIPWACKSMKSNTKVKQIKVKNHTQIKVKVNKKFAIIMNFRMNSMTY